MLLNSKRIYQIAIVDANGIHLERVAIGAIVDLKNDYEYAYALQEVLDKVLDLKAGESMYFHPNRDNKDVKGIILRET